MSYDNTVLCDCNFFWVLNQARLPSIPTTGLLDLSVLAYAVVACVNKLLFISVTIMLKS